ncbi:uncharacterized protein LOC115216552 [Octopus sinensis]|uniref:Uncharacterized protein LOC115216552 n=1 Tax=Octopus sinensis TaxID=2607531 RepID=A0A6P7SU86_9MOLL|nr:uncharacterized protein LOC115216552 [Octopus sinensis]
MQDGIAPYERNEISEILKKQKFSVLIDESTDTNLSNSCSFFLMNNLLDAIVNGSSQGLNDAVKSTLTKEDASISSILGFACVNYSTLTGNKGRFQKLMRNDIPTVFTTGCVCHSFALCSSHAVRVLPSYLEPFFKGLNFSRSGKRQIDFNMIQSAVGTKENNIPKLSQTR